MISPRHHDSTWAEAFVRIATSEGVMPSRRRPGRVAAAVIGFSGSAAVILASQSPQSNIAASLGSTRSGVTQESPDMKSATASTISLSAALIASPAVAATIRVPLSYPTIQEAVASASDGDVIELAAGAYTEVVVISGKKLTIQGASGAECTLGASRVAIYGSAAPGVYFRGIRFTASSGSGLGGAVVAQDSHVAFVDCAFDANTITGGSGTHGGAALYASNCRLVMRSTTVTDNSVTLLSGGYPFAFGGAILADRCIVDISGCAFARNTCSATVPGASWAEARSMGGAIALRWGSGTVSNCSFDSNSTRSEVHGYGPIASTFGGAINASGTPGTGLTVHDCVFTQNHVEAVSDNAYYGGGGGALAGGICFGPDQAQSGSHAVRDCLFLESRSDKSPSTNGEGVSDIAFVARDSGTVERCRFGSSSAPALTGNAIVGAVVAFGGAPSFLSDSSFCGANCAAYSVNVQATSVDIATTCADCDGNGSTDLEEIVAGAPDANANGVPDNCDCLSDLNADGRVDGADLSAILAFWGPNPVFAPTDLNRDGIVNGQDLAEVLSNWGNCPG